MLCSTVTEYEVVHELCSTPTPTEYHSAKPCMQVKCSNTNGSMQLSKISSNYLTAALVFSEITVTAVLTSRPPDRR